MVKVDNFFFHLSRPLEMLEKLIIRTDSSNFYLPSIFFCQRSMFIQQWGARRNKVSQLTKNHNKVTQT